MKSLIALLVAILGASAQIQISYEDAQGWNGGEYLSYVEIGDDWADSLAIEAGDNVLWDFTQFTFDTTIQRSYRIPDGNELSVFPEATHVAPLDFYTFLYEGGPISKTAALFEQRQVDAWLTLGYANYTANDSLYASRTFISADTLISFPMTYGQTRSSAFELSRISYYPVRIEVYDSLKKEVNSFGKIVLPGNDTLDALGMRISGHYHVEDSGQGYEHSTYIQAFVIFTREHGITCYLQVGVNPSEPIDCFTPGTPTVLGQGNVGVGKFLLMALDAAGTGVIPGMQSLRYDKVAGPVHIGVFDVQGKRIGTSVLGSTSKRLATGLFFFGEEGSNRLRYTLMLPGRSGHEIGAPEAQR